jgi:hypothetical protein
VGNGDIRIPKSKGAATFTAGSLTASIRVGDDLGTFIVNGDVVDLAHHRGQATPGRTRIVIGSIKISGTFQIRASGVCRRFVWTPGECRCAN